MFWALAEAYGRYAVATGSTALHGMRMHLRGGSFLAIIVLLGAAAAQVSGLPVLAGLVARLSCEALRLALPAIPSESPVAVLGCSVLLGIGTYAVLRAGRYDLWEKTMVVASALMLIGFIGAAGIAGFSSKEAEVFIPVAADEGGWAARVALIGTAVAAPTFLVRALMMRGKGWTPGNSMTFSFQRRDAFIAAVGLVVLVGSIMACGVAARGNGGVRDLFDLAPALEARGGRVAAGLFLLGAIGAGVTSFIPMAMVLPLLLADFNGTGWSMNTVSFRAWSAGACLLGAAGPLVGAHLLPLHKLAGQIGQVFVLPLAVAGAFLLVNRRALMREQAAGLALNAGLIAAFGCSLVLAASGLVALGRRFG